MTSTLSSQRFCLRWNNHQSNLLSVFDQLLHDESFVDVTLAVEGRYLKAHKMVLSACSPYFQALFVGHPDRHPIVILKDVPYCDMRSLLDFMYRGEVSVDQERLTAFLKVAESLRIKGLTEVNEERCDLPSITSSLLSSAPLMGNTHTPPPPPHLHRIHPIQHHRRNLQMPSATPLLGSALTAPKRKRGRPRKLSGSSGGAPAGSENPHKPSAGNGDMDAMARLSDSLMSQGSPEMLEVRMGMEFQQSGGSAGANRPAEAENGSIVASEPSDQGETPAKESPPPKRVKEEPEPTPGPSSQDPGQAYARPSSTQDSSDQFSQVSDSSYTGYIKEEHPSITFQLVTPTSEYHHTSSTLTIINDGDHQDPKMGLVVQSLTESTPGVHFLSHEVEEDGRECILVTKYEDDDDLDDSLMEAGLDPLLEAGIKDKSDLLEYLIREDGSVVCKWCGEVLPSRTHWYRHKYKFHVPSSVSPSPTTVLKTATLLKCHRCNVFFKSRKGFTGHLASRHSEEDKSQSEDNGRELEQPQPRPARRSTRGLEAQNRGADYEKQREKEEKLVADIIDRVRRECEAQGATVTRRGYTRRSTVMNS